MLWPTYFNISLREKMSRKVSYLSNRCKILTNLHKHWDCARKLSATFEVFVFKL